MQQPMQVLLLAQQASLVPMLLLVLVPQRLREPMLQVGRKQRR
jgi:hypothetical protein